LQNCEGKALTDHCGRLMRLKRRSMRRGIWYKILSSLERAQVDLTVRTVKKVRSPLLHQVLDRIVGKLCSALQSKVLLKIESVGVPLALKLSLLAQRWENKSAEAWSQDVTFARFSSISSQLSPIPSRFKSTPV